MSHNSPLVSIVVRTKDRPKLLKRAVQSISQQTYRPLEVVLVNDGGCELDTGALQTILGDVALNYVRFEQNTGRAHAGNVGIRHTQGDFIGFLDDDDAFYTGHFALLSNFLQGSDYKVAYSDSEIVYRTYIPEKNKFIEMKGGIFSSTDFSPEVLLFENYIPFISVLFEGEALRSSGGFDESFEIYEDWDLLIRLSSQMPFHHIAIPTSKYTQWSKDYQIAHVNWEKARESYIRILQKHTDRRSPEIIYRYYTIKDEAIRKRDREIKELRDEKNQLQCSLESIETAGANPSESDTRSLREVVDLRKQLEEIHSSFGWRMLSFYRQHVKSLLFPTGTKRGKFYTVTLESLPLLKEKGVRFTLSKGRNMLIRAVSQKNIYKEQYQVPVINEETKDALHDTVSVVIPTRNAGPDFRYTLEKIRSQKKLGGIEIILIDSGSTDGTLSLAERYGVQIYSIDPSDFNHGTTRNYGAEKASGNFLIFMSQDAIPIGDFCIFETVSKMQRDGMIAAASVKQVPRSDADLFACWQLWFYNNKLLDYLRDSVMFIKDKDIATLSVQEKRRFMQLDNVFACYRKSVFDQFRFNNLPYGEDLDLGIRLIQADYKILFLTSVGVIHSHKRDDEYFFQRGYIDTRTLIRLLKYDPIDWEAAGIHTLHQLMAYTHMVDKRVNRAIKSLYTLDVGDRSLETILKHFKTVLCSEIYGAYQEESSFDETFYRIVQQEFGTYKNLDLHYDVLMNQFVTFLDSFSEYLHAGNFNISQKNMGAFIDALCKIIAWTCGSNIGNYVVFSEQGARVGK
jgi:glycosyltransferase involved in cell wall biosynthesis